MVNTSANIHTAVCHSYLFPTYFHPFPRFLTSFNTAIYNHLYISTLLCYHSVNYAAYAYIYILYIVYIHMYTLSMRI